MKHLNEEKVIEEYLSGKNLWKIAKANGCKSY